MLRPGTTIAGRVLDRKSGAGRPPGPRADRFSGLHSGTGALQQNNYCQRSLDNLCVIAVCAFIKLFVYIVFIVLK